MSSIVLYMLFHTNGEYISCVTFVYSMRTEQLFATAIHFKWSGRHKMLAHANVPSIGSSGQE